MKIPKPSRREEIALFRLGVIGDLLSRELSRGELAEELLARSQRRYRPPGASRTRTYHVKTLQRWYYAAKKESPSALQPEARSKGHARSLSEEQRQFLLEMRKAHRSAPAELILSEAIRHGVVAKGAVSVSTLRRHFAQANLSRVSRKRADRADVQRRRWQAANPGDLWHGDVCHLVLVDDLGKPRRVLVHGLLDDASRHFTALAGRTTEQERDMLEVFCGALLKHPKPRTLYLDNGSCYRGDLLALVCQRLGIGLVHAPPYSPENRGKMERVWRTMRQRCTDHLPGGATLHEVNLALWAWLDVDYHRRPHAGLLGKTPRKCYLEGLAGRPLTPKELARALEVTETRQVRKDGTFSVDGTIHEVNGRHLAGKRVTIVIDGLTGRLLRATYQDRALRFGLCDSVANRDRKRPPTTADDATTDVPFDPIANLLQKAREATNE